MPCWSNAGFQIVDITLADNYPILMSSANRSLTIFAPALIEEGHLEAAIGVVTGAAGEVEIDYEVIIIVDDKSVDMQSVIS